MSDRYPGGFLTNAAPTVSTSSATGIWTPEQQLGYEANGDWPSQPAGPTQISRSLRFNAADSTYLNRTPGSAGNRKTWTFSAWVKRTNFGGFFPVLQAGYSSTPWFVCGFDNGTQLEITATAGSSASWVTSSVFRDPNAWYHLVFAVDTTSATGTMAGTSTDRIRAYVNGVQVVLTGGTVPTQDSDLQVNNTVAHTIGGYAAGGSTYYCSGYMANIDFVDGLALDASYFGAVNATTGVWEPVTTVGYLTYGTNGFHLDFADNTSTTTIGYDTSGNGNNWTATNFSVTAGKDNDSLTDTPTPYGTDTGAGGEVRGNYATWNTLETIMLGNCPAYNGNLQAGEVTSGGNVSIRSSMFPSSGKWYAEFVVSNGTNGSYPEGFPRIGVSRQDAYQVNTYGTGVISFGPTGELFVDSTTNTWNSGGLSSYVQGDILMVAFDTDSRKVWFGKNGSWYNFSGSGADPATGTNPVGTLGGTTPITFQVRPQWCKIDGNFGQRPFSYTAPSGFKALCTQNLPTPDVVQGDTAFNTVLWTGDGTSSRAITGVGFQPDMVWYKSRSDAVSHRLFDAVRGANKELIPNVTDAEYTASNELLSFDSDGFTIGDEGATNGNGYTFVGWNWKANGAGSSNTDGTITSTVSANTTAGISVVTFTNTSGNQTVGHGLGVAPSMIILKNRSNTSQWPVYHSSLTTPATQWLQLNTTDAVQTASPFWGASGVTSTTFGISDNVTQPSSTFVAYCFAQVDGFSAFGKYTGNGSSDGPFVYTGFRPAFLLWKLSSSSGYNWRIHDIARNTYNTTDKTLYPNNTDAETTLDQTDFLSNGFKVRNTDTGDNANGETYIYMAFAENPFKYALAR